MELLIERLWIFALGMWAGAALARFMFYRANRKTLNVNLAGPMTLSIPTSGDFEYTVKRTTITRAREWSDFLAADERAQEDRINQRIKADAEEAKTNE